MEQSEALDIIEEYKKAHGLPGTLEALEAMEEDRENLTPRQRIGWNVAMQGFSRLFNGHSNVRQL
jgi:hypothetical protein